MGRNEVKRVVPADQRKNRTEEGLVKGGELSILVSQVGFDGLFYLIVVGTVDLGSHGLLKSGSVWGEVAGCSSLGSRP